MTYLKKNKDKNKTILGLSGGVDSTAAALLLKENDYEVIGAFLDVGSQGITNDADKIESCISEDISRAEHVAGQLEIGFIYENVAKNFADIVINDFCSEYISGRTPNPCIICNPEVKFKTLIQIADRESAYHIATGHYADKVYDEEKKLWFISKSRNEKKDQSYMLYRLNQHTISRLILPLNKIRDKEDVREKARKHLIDNADSADSQEICFLDRDNDYRKFISDKGYRWEEGYYTDIEGNILGRHKGLINYTIGQRKGLGLALGRPMYVKKMDPDTNSIVLGKEEELFVPRIYSVDNILMGTELQRTPESHFKKIYSEFKNGAEVKAKIRYGAEPANAAVYLHGDGSLITEFHTPQRAPAPGQSVVFYQNDKVIGGGFIRTL